MDETTPRMTNLFLQLGLDAGEQDIARFIQAHQIAADVHICDAPFWNPAQSEFLAEQIKADAPWALVVDQLNEALHADAVQQGAERR